MTKTVKSYGIYRGDDLCEHFEDKNIAISMLKVYKDCYQEDIHLHEITINKGKLIK